MVVRIARSTRMPTLYSCYITNYKEETADEIKENRPFCIYHRKTDEYETTQEVVQTLTESVDQLIDERVKVPYFKLKRTGKYGFQEDAVEFALTVKDVFLNFTQGMGKTLTTLKIIEARKFKKTLVICGQGNLQEEWVKDSIKHNKHSLNIRIVGDDSGSSHKDKQAWLARTTDESGIDLINVEALRNEAIVSSLNNNNYDCIVVDEVQAVKGIRAEQTKGLLELDRHEGQCRIALSGTPILNDPLEFYVFLRFFGLLKETARTTFNAYYGEWSFDHWGHHVCTGYKNVDQLIELIKVVICIAPKSRLDLPPKIRRKVNLDGGGTARLAELRSLYKASLKKVKAAGFKTKQAIRAEMIYLTATLQSKIDFVSSIANRQLVFSQYTTVLATYKEQLERQGKKVLYYHGGLNMKQRLEVLASWRDHEADILLLSVKTARYGLNLTEACETTFVDIPDSISVLEQCEDRAHRIGQTNTCRSWLLSAGDLDESNLERIERKQIEIDKIMGQFMQNIVEDYNETIR